MSEKRRRAQKRRTRRSASTRSGARAGAADRELARLMDGMVETVLRSMRGIGDPLAAECWASQLVSMWTRYQLIEGEAMAEFMPAFVRALERKRTPSALAALRALSAVGSEREARGAQMAADRVAARGVREPSWSDWVGRAEPVAAELMHDPVFDDGVSVMIEFATHSDERHTLGIYIDHNMGGLIKDVFLAGPLADVIRDLRAAAPGGTDLTLRPLELAEARVRVEQALYMLDHTLNPPVDDDVHSLRALIETRVGLLPEGFSLPHGEQEVPIEERERLQADFLASPEGRRWCGDEDADEVIFSAIWFGSDYNHGGPLRWSPVVVEIFMTSWLARKLAREPAFFARVPEVLQDWVRYAGRMRGVPDEPLSEAVQAVAEFRSEMLEAVRDPEAWGPAKTFALAARAAGVDLADPDALDAFVDRYNEGLAA